ncbi:NAD(P)-binding protein [Leucogyrophana mollusca]|uniref:NAD(P)-binding protein n=1 Tax=Leucogyrophana mollusca TaxID=85980 RepID=A0ACB8C0L9_9AGAM|nr:NAD(P)-binding protein [Leucogyrophana mollusca]
MSAKDIISAYAVAVPGKQSQPQPGLDKDIDPGVEYIAQEYWDNDGKPHLRDYVGSGKLQGKYAIITGGDSGIGRSAAIMFAREGARGITFSYLPEEEADAKHAANAIKKDGQCEVNALAINLQDEAACKKLVDSHVQKFGTISILVNNAGKQLICQDFDKIDLANVRSTFESNILQMFAVTKFALPHMKRGSSIINTTSVVAYAGAPNLVDYSSTKGAILTFTRSLALQLAPKGIRVNAVAPGPVMTALQPASRDAEEMEHFGVGTPMHGRAAQPAELGPAFVFLASPDSNVMTGACMHVNNGMHVGGS